MQTDEQQRVWTKANKGNKDQGRWFLMEDSPDQIQTLNGFIVIGILNDPLDAYGFGT